MANNNFFNNLTDRHAAITDGVFAIAMTILVLEIAVPTVSDITSGVALNEYFVNYLFPSILIYFLILFSFRLGLTFSNTLTDLELTFTSSTGLPMIFEVSLTKAFNCFLESGKEDNFVWVCKINSIFPSIFISLILYKSKPSTLAKNC